MTDIISPGNSVRLQQKSSRRVCLQQNKTLNKIALNSALTTEIPSAFHLLRNDFTSINQNACVTSPSRPSSFSKATQITSLKSSLKQKNNNLPSTTKKRVRFNFPLTQVMHFYTPPNIDEDENKIDSVDGNGQDENQLEDTFLKLFNSLFSSSDYDSNLYHPVIQQHIFDASSNKLIMILPNWPTVHPTKRFITQMVSLENLSWDNACSIIKGRVLVHNLAYEKQVTVRMSFNHWQTWIDVNATYRESSKDDALDRFDFELVTPNHLSYINRICNHSSCSLAVRYQVNGRDFWDNNNGDNFNLRWETQMDDNYEARYEYPIQKNSYLIDSREQRHSLYQPIVSVKATNSDQSKKNKSHYILLNGPQYSTENHHLKSPALSLPSEQNQHQTSSLSSDTQQQISAHFQLYLERKRRSEERHRISSSKQSTKSSNNAQVLLSI